MKLHKVGDICRITLNCSVYDRLCEIVEILENDDYQYHVKIVDTETFTFMNHDELVLVEANSGKSKVDTVSEIDQIIDEANEKDIERFLRSERGREVLRELLRDIIG